MITKIEPKGMLFFRLVSSSVGTFQLEEMRYTAGDLGDPYVDEWIEDHTVKNENGFLSGEEFLEGVKNTWIMNSDGCINKIYVDSYISNLGLACSDLVSGEFLVDEVTFKNICEDYDVIVDWSDK